MAWKKRILIAGIVLAAGTSSWFLLRPEKEPILIGVVGPMSGKDATVGRPLANGATLYFEDLNQRGGINGRKILLIIKDDQNQPRLARARAEELCRDKRVVAVIGHRYSGPTLAARTVYEQAAVPTIAPTASNPAITRNSPWHFRMVYNDTFQAQFVVHYAKRVFQSKAALVFYTDTTYGKSLSRDFSAEAAKTGLRIIRQVQVPRDVPFVPDQALIRQLQRCDLAYLALHYKDGIRVMRTLAPHRKDVRFFGGDSIGSALFPKQGKDAVEGVYSVSFFLPDVLGYSAKRFIRRYENRFAQTMEWGAAMAYDASHLLAQALIHEGVSRKAVRNYLAATDSPQVSINGLSGRLFFNQQGDCMRPISVSQVREGHYRSAKIQLSYVKDKELLTEKEQEEVFDFKGNLMTRTAVVYAGIHINRMETFDAKHSCFTADLLLWFRWWSPLQSIDFRLIQARVLSRKQTAGYVSPESGEKYACYQMRAKFNQDFLYHNYPFDKHVLSMRIKHATLPAHRLKFVTDIPKLPHLTTRMDFEDWRSTGMYHFVEYMSSTRSLRDPRTRGRTVSDEYPIYTYQLHVSRIFLPYLIKIILPLCFILAVAFLAFFIHPKEFETNIAIGITALLSAIAFHITQGENLPNIGYIVTADLFFIFTYALIFFSIVESVVSNSLYYKQKLDLAIKVDRVSVVVFPVMLLLIIGFIIIRNL